jgi:hypothetical protein
MSPKPAKKPPRGRKPVTEDMKKTVLRVCIPSLQAQAAKAAAFKQGLEFNEFVEKALKEAIYEAALLTHAQPDATPQVEGGGDAI